MTVAERMRLEAGNFTPSEHRLASALLDNYPLAGLGSVAQLGRDAGVSAPTVVRMVHKLGFSGYPEFQAELRSELEAQLSTPLTKHQLLSSSTPSDDHILVRFAAAAIDNIHKSLKVIDTAVFEQTVGLIADPSRAVYLLGGRLTDPLASYLHRHLHMARPRVFKLSAERTLWPQYMIDVGKRDVLVLFDIRRYDRDLAKFARQAASGGAEIVLFTDQWLSPVHRHSRCSFPIRIEAPSSWDSAAATLTVVEALIAAVAERLWDTAETRIATLEQIADPSGRRPR